MDRVGRRSDLAEQASQFIVDRRDLAIRRRGLHPVQPDGESRDPLADVLA